MEKLEHCYGLLFHLLVRQNLLKQLSTWRFLMALTNGLCTRDSFVTLFQRLFQRGHEQWSVFCKSHNGHVLRADSTSTHAPFFAVYCRSELGMLDSNMLEEEGFHRFVPDVT